MGLRNNFNTAYKSLNSNEGMSTILQNIFLHFVF